MRTLQRQVGRGVSAGEPLPDPWPIFGKNRATFRRGSIAMIAGPPGSMKTVTMLNIVRRMGPSVPTIYHSSDSDDFTMASRSLSMLTGKTSDETELWVSNQDPVAQKELAELDYIKWSFVSSPTVEHMWNEAEAFREVHGTYPHHTVVDILMKVDYDGISEYNYQNLMNEFSDMAREQETAVTLVHHTSESFKAGSPPPRSAIIGKGSQLPTLMLTLWGDSQLGKIDIAVVKNRFGPQDPMAETFFTMNADASRCRVEELPSGQSNASVMIFRDGSGVPDAQKVNLFGEA